MVVLRGEALNILQTVPTGKQRDYKLVISRLEMLYGEAHVQQIYHIQVKSRLQQPSESLHELEADIARLVRLAYPTPPNSFLEKLAVQTFIDGLKDVETQTILASCPTEDPG